MPICEVDPWRFQYFERVPCPPDVFIPTEDSDAWLWNPRHRWIYDKLQVAHRQRLIAAPHGVSPPTYPVFSKPIYNLKGMGVGSGVLRSVGDYENAYRPGHMWVELLEGEHYSTDIALASGEPRWSRRTRGISSGDGTFDYWEVNPEPAASLDEELKDWCRNHLSDYTGMLNLETIGGRIIEAHLRFSDQWPDLYGGDEWVASVVELYTKGSWSYGGPEARTGYSVVLFMPHGRRYHMPAHEFLGEILSVPEISSLQITFHDDMAPERHAMPPGGFRVAIVNCWQLAAGVEARHRLRCHFERSF